MENIKEIASQYLNSKNNIFSEEELKKYNPKIKKKLLNSLGDMTNSEIRKVIEKYPEILNTSEDEINPLFYSALTNDLSKNRVILNMLIDNGLKTLPDTNDTFKKIKKNTSIFEFCVMKDLDISLCFLLTNISNPDVLDFKRMISTSLIYDSHKVFSVISKVFDENLLQENLLNLYSFDPIKTYVILNNIMDFKVSNFQKYSIDLSFKTATSNYLKSTAISLGNEPYNYLPEEKANGTDFEHSEKCLEKIEVVKKFLNHLIVKCNLDWHEESEIGITSRKNIEKFFTYCETYKLSQRHSEKLNIQQFYKEIDLFLLNRKISKKEETTKKIKI